MLTLPSIPWLFYPNAKTYQGHLWPFSCLTSLTHYPYRTLFDSCSVHEFYFEIAISLEGPCNFLCRPRDRTLGLSQKKQALHHWAISSPWSWDACCLAWIVTHNIPFQKPVVTIHTYHPSLLRSWGSKDCLSPNFKTSLDNILVRANLKTKTTFLWWDDLWHRWADQNCALSPSPLWFDSWVWWVWRTPGPRHPWPWELLPYDPCGSFAPAQASVGLCDSANDLVSVL